MSYILQSDLKGLETCSWTVRTKGLRVWVLLYTLQEGSAEQSRWSGSHYVTLMLSSGGDGQAKEGGGGGVCHQREGAAGADGP